MNALSPRAFQAPAPSYRILIVTDAWAPQVNGVVRTLEFLGRELSGLGHTVRFATPKDHTTIPLPTYPEIRLSLFPRARLARLFDEFDPDAIHIATEGTLGLAARALCRERGWRFTTSFHTRFPEYVHARFPFISESAVYSALRKFHAPAQAMMVSTPALMQELAQHGFSNCCLWSRGVDVDLFKPAPKQAFAKLGLDLPRPVFLYVGRLAVEKNVEAFLAADLPGSKVVIGDGPLRAVLAARYPAAHFMGTKTGPELAQFYASSDVFVFPSRTDTFGLVLLEALACGVPVAAYPVQGPRDVIGDAPVGVLDNDLRAAALRALTISPESCRAFALRYSWRASAEQFVDHLATDNVANAA
jgi:glycosyltransferase involved in cell wall biosynthesis